MVLAKHKDWLSQSIMDRYLFVNNVLAILFLSIDTCIRIYYVSGYIFQIYFPFEEKMTKEPENILSFWEDNYFQPDTTSHVRLCPTYAGLTIDMDLQI